MTDEPAKVDLETPDLAADNRALFERVFPGVLADGVVDPERLGALLDVPVAQVSGGRERYGLMWAGKQDAVRSLLTPSRGTLLPVLEKSVDFDRAENVFIEGDNLEVLKLLQKAYNDKVKMIFIDPPYNTGSDLVYDDDFSDGIRGYLEYTGQLDAQGHRTTTNVETAGRVHSRWLSMIYPRLVLARNLLQQDGVIFVSIDDTEISNLRLVLDEIFGQENFVATIVWQSRTSISDDLEVSPNHNYIVIYARNLAELTFWGEPIRQSEYSNPDDDPRGPWKLVPLDANKPGGDTLYEVVNPQTGQSFWPPQGRSWAINSQSMTALIADGRVKFGLGGTSAPKRKLFLRERLERGDSRTPSSILLDAGTTKDGSAEIAQLFGRKRIFDYPKPVALLKRLLRYGAGGAKGALILDFFAGSATTAHAVLELNAEDGGSRRCISVQLPEPTPAGSEARKAGFDTIADVGWARLMRAMEKVGGNAQGLRAFELGPSHFRIIDSDPSSLLHLYERTLVSEFPDLTAVAAEVFLQEGVPLHAPWLHTTFTDAEIIRAGDVALVLSTHITSQLANAALDMKQPVVVFLEDGFAGSDAVKANAFTNAKNANITMKTV